VGSLETDWLVLVGVTWSALHDQVIGGDVAGLVEEVEEGSKVIQAFARSSCAHASPVVSHGSSRRGTPSLP
jgi:hypothetical protein